MLPPGLSFSQLLQDEDKGEEEEGEIKPVPPSLSNENNVKQSAIRQKRKKKGKVSATPKNSKGNSLEVYSIHLKEHDEKNITCIVLKKAISFSDNHPLFAKAREMNKTTPMPLDVNEKYYNQRYYLFSLYDQGIQMDAESWYSVTPEQLAIYISKLCHNKTVLDAFCGCGGNAIQFSKECTHVYAIDVDASKIALCRNNSKVYSCADNITFINCDYLKYDPGEVFVDYVFLSPPWGGVDYDKDESFSLKKWITPDIHEIIRQSLRCGSNLIFYLPRSTNIEEFLTILIECHEKLLSSNGEWEEEDDSLFIEVRYLLNTNKVKAILILSGEDFNTLTVKDLRVYLERIYDSPTQIALKQSITLAKNIGVNLFITEELTYRKKHSKCSLNQFNDYFSTNRIKTSFNAIKKEVESLIPLNKLLSIDDYAKLKSNRLEWPR